MRDAVSGMVDKLLEEAVARFCAGENKDWDVTGLSDYVERLCVPHGTMKANQDAIAGFDRDGMSAFLKKAAADFYAGREAEITALGIDMRELERSILLRAVDIRWMDHIDAMDQLRDGIGLRAYAQRDPVNEYRLESYDMFDEMSRLIQEDTVRQLFQLRIQRAPERRQVARPMQEGAATGAGMKGGQPLTKKAGEKIGRNSPCPCGSGKKYKHCHGMPGRSE